MTKYNNLIKNYHQYLDKRFNSFDWDYHKIDKILKKTVCYGCGKTLRKGNKTLTVACSGESNVVYRNFCLKCGSEKLKKLIDRLKRTKKKITKEDLMLERL